MKESIYLVGQISVDVPESYEWRKNVRRVFGTNRSFEIIDPCNNGFNQEVLKLSGQDSDRSRVYRTKGINLLVPKDRSYVERSTMGIANMNYYDSKKLIVGSFFELAWYYDSPEKSVIGIFNGDPTKDFVCNHPFVKRAVDIWVKDEWEACEYAIHYFQNVFTEQPSFEETRTLMARLKDLRCVEEGGN